MEGYHRAIVHLVDMIAGQDQHIFGIMYTDDIQILVHRIGGAFVPSLVNALLRRQQLDKLTELAAQESPAFLYVA